MNAIEFILWLNGATEILGDQPPTPEQWAAMREKLGSAVGAIVATRLLEHADAFQKAEAVKRQLAEDRARTFGALAPHLLGPATAAPKPKPQTTTAFIAGRNARSILDNFGEVGPVRGAGYAR